MGHTVLIVGPCDTIRSGLYIRNRIGDSDSHTADSKHFHIIYIIAKRYNIV